MSLLDGLRKGRGAESTPSGAAPRRRLKDQNDHLPADRLAAALGMLADSSPAEGASKAPWVPQRASGVQALQARLRAGAPDLPTPVYLPPDYSPPVVSPPETVLPPVPSPVATPVVPPVVVSLPVVSLPLLSPPVKPLPVVSLPLLSPPVRALPGGPRPALPAPLATPPAGLDNGRHRGTSEQVEDWVRQPPSSIRPPRHGQAAERALRAAESAGSEPRIPVRRVSVPAVSAPVASTSQVPVSLVPAGGRHRAPAPTKRSLLTVPPALQAAQASARSLAVVGVLVLVVAFVVVFGLHLASVSLSAQPQPVAVAAHGQLGTLAAKAVPVADGTLNLAR